jgi:hypothetical protein
MRILTSHLYAVSRYDKENHIALSPQYGALFYMAVSILVPQCGCRVN